VLAGEQVSKPASIKAAVENAAAPDVGAMPMVKTQAHVDRDAPGTTEPERRISAMSRVFVTDPPADTTKVLLCLLERKRRSAQTGVPAAFHRALSGNPTAVRPRECS
jgi:hypothetical protein